MDFALFFFFFSSFLYCANWLMLVSRQESAGYFYGYIRPTARKIFDGKIFAKFILKFRKKVLAILSDRCYYIKCTFMLRKEEEQ